MDIIATLYPRIELSTIETGDCFIFEITNIFNEIFMIVDKQTKSKDKIFVINLSNGLILELTKTLRVIKINANISIDLTNQ